MFERTNEASEIESISYQTLSGLSYWAGFVGVWTIIGAVLGIIGSIAGMVANPFSIFGVISAVIALIMGLKLRSSKKEFDSFVHSKASINLEIALDSLRHYFRILLVLNIVLFAVIALLLLLFLQSRKKTSFRSESIIHKVERISELSTARMTTLLIFEPERGSLVPGTVQRFIFIVPFQVRG
ncbi:MAG: Uncharacterized protein XE02_1708 [Mesotoga infera]|uniref:Uncharacterized protein n=1 Tax=Mesotoga infera TaxID=1236046 RepID=A0A117M4S5_9BACT|nr:MAG: Uncharacterized protein XE02_1708 [Mesotoga infera]